ncbi:hypothetical protein [Haloarchaeobius litoreus]|uniref:Uncharacterized protein n=1 Tax=Haloarchaeobius litoreus TaxID=755306 RepID=A0ABD6DQB6_9EURY|nr:hypothetical protein [Haloarchaeobius litoreus]
MSTRQLALAGCLGVLRGNSNPDVVLGDPGRPFDSEDVAYPAWDEPLPAVTLPAPLESREVQLDSMEKSRGVDAWRDLGTYSRHVQLVAGAVMVLAGLGQVYLAVFELGMLS